MSSPRVVVLLARTSSWQVVKSWQWRRRNTPCCRYSSSRWHIDTGLGLRPKWSIKRSTLSLRFGLGAPPKVNAADQAPTSMNCATTIWTNIASVVIVWCWLTCCVGFFFPAVAQNQNITTSTRWTQKSIPPPLTPPWLLLIFQQCVQIFARNSILPTVNQQNIHFTTKFYWIISENDKTMLLEPR